MNEQHPNPEVAMWRTVIAALVRRYPPAEAFENASLLLAAYRRRRAESQSDAHIPSDPDVHVSEHVEGLAAIGRDDGDR